jgi:N-acetylglucosamine kinase-like BadF-type ATPase
VQYVVGVDGGGTKTAAAVVAEDLSVASKMTTGPSNGRSVGMEAASANIAEAIAQALRAAATTLGQVSAICLCLAGFDTELDLPVPEQAMRTLGYHGPLIVENDVVGAWAGATEVRPGVVVIAGTGATALGMNDQGDFWRTDGWDYLLGDAGSGFAIGHAGIQMAMRALDGRLAPTRLAHKLSEAYGVQNAGEMRHLVDATHFGKFEIARFATAVTTAAQEGDVVAQAILAQAGTDLGESATAIIRRLGMQGARFGVSTVGGVFTAATWVLPPFQRALALAAPGATLQPATHPPEVGAALLAWHRLQQNDLGSWTLGTGRRRIWRSLSIEEATPR